MSASPKIVALLGLNSTGPRPGPKLVPKRGSEIVSVSVSKSEAFPHPFPRLAGASITYVKAVLSIVPVSDSHSPTLLRAR